MLRVTLFAMFAAFASLTFAATDDKAAAVEEAKKAETTGDYARFEKMTDETAEEAKKNAEKAEKQADEVKEAMPEALR